MPYLLAPAKLVCLALVLAIACGVHGIATYCQAKSEFQLREAASQPPTPPQSRVIAAVPVLSGAGTAAGDPQ